MEVWVKGEAMLADKVRTKVEAGLFRVRVWT